MHRPSLLATLLAVALLAPMAPAAAAPSPVTQPAAVVEPRRDSPGAGEPLVVTELASRYEGSHLRYRIPALTTLPNGDLLAVYDGRPTMADLPSNIALLMRRSTDGGATWQDQEVIRQDPAPNGYGDPSVLVDRETGRVFVFYAASIKQGFAGSAVGNDPTDPNVLHADYSYSDDDGVTWTHRRITEMFKDPAWGGMFAASGEGIQLRHGEHAGRLIQQYTVRANGGNYAVSAYSDDHGETWQRSALVGPGADENKTVELADGRVLLNSRAAPYRNVAVSTDGGATYSPFSQDTELVDPANNGSVVRAFPDAPAGDPRAEILLFSNTEDSGIRRNLTVKMSCDSGETWPVRKVVEGGAAGYSTLTPLGDGTSDDALGGSYGMLFEREGYRHLSYTSFDLDWLEGTCAPLAVASPPTFVAGQQGEVSVTVSNQGAVATAPGTLVLDETPGWSATPAEVPAIAPGESTAVALRITPAVDAAARSHEISLRYRTGAVTSSVRVSVPVVSGSVLVSSDGPHVLAGDSVPVDLTDRLGAVRSLASGAIAVTFSTTKRSPAAVLFSAADTTSTVRAVVLSVNQGKPYFEVRTGASSWPVRITTSVDVADGAEHTLVAVGSGTSTRLLLDGRQIGSASTGQFFSTVSGLNALGLGANQSSNGNRWGFDGTILRAAVLGPVTPAPAVTVLPVLDAVYPGGGDGMIGDQVAPWIRITNSGNVPLATIALSGPDNSGSCSRTTPLAPGDSYVCKSVRHVVTAADVAAGSWAPTFVADAVAAGGATTSARSALAPVDVSSSGPGGDATVWVPSGRFESSSFVRVPRSGGAPAASLTADTVLDVRIPSGGRTSAQLAVSAGTPVGALRASGTTFEGPGGATIPSSAMTVRFPQYIPDLVAGGVVADPLREVPTVDVAAGQNQPLWFTIEVPAGTAAGTYEGEITVATRAGELGSWPLRVEVPAVELRPMDERPFVLDLWAQPDSVAAERGVELWSEQHWTALKPYLEDLADHGQEVVNAAIVQDPWLVNSGGAWRPQTQTSYNSTVEWIWDGAEFRFDYDVFDRYVTESRAAGIGDTIHAFAMLQFSGPERLVYTDSRTGKTVTEQVTLGNARYREAWTAFLQSFRAHLEEKGWFDDTRLAFDERPIATMNVAFDVIAEAEPAWSDKVSLAANSLAEADIADSISFNYSFLDSVPDSLIQSRLDEGQPTLFYTFYDPQRPNTVTASPPVSTRVLGWVVEQRDLDGYLRWTYNSWPTDVYEDPSFRYGQGDEYLVYPGADGPVSSIRWEVFRDGQDDAELLNLAKEELGEDAPAVTTALAAVDPRAVDGEQTWRNLLGQRDVVLDAMVAQTTGVVATGPVSADVLASRDARSPITLSLPLSNGSGAAKTVTFGASAQGPFTADPVEVVVPAGGTTTARLVLDPAGRTGAASVEAVATLDGAVLATGTFDLISGGVHVSDLGWVSSLNGWGPAERDRSNGEDASGDGGALRISGRTYAKGIGAHATSKVVLDLPGACTALRSDYGIDDEVSGAASVEMEVLGDGVSLWRSARVTPASKAQHVDVDLTGVRRLELIVHDGGNGIGQDHADWAGAWVECPPPVQPAPEVRADVTVAAQCAAGRAQLKVLALNVEEVPMDVRLVTPVGTKSFTGLAPGSRAQQTFSSRAATLAAGAVTVEVSATTDGEPATAVVEKPFDAAGCS